MSPLPIYLVDISISQRVTDGTQNIRSMASRIVLHIMNSNHDQAFLELVLLFPAPLPT